MKKSTFALFSVSVLIVSSALTRGFHYVRANWLASPPLLQCPDTLNLGEWEAGKTAVGHFRIKNGGKEKLTANEFLTSCSCAGVEREIDGRFVKVKALEVAPGAEMELAVRVAVGARPGMSHSVLVSFATNDPAHPSWQMIVVVPRVTGGYFPEPSAVIFGDLLLGAKTSRIIDLYDNGSPGRELQNIHVTHPDRFTATLLPLSDEEKHRAHATAGKLFARIEIAPYCGRPGPINGEIHVYLAKERQITEPIPVVGEVLNPVECRPTAMTLPRRIAGQSVLAGDVLILNRSGQPIEVAIDYLPPHITADIRTVPHHPDQRLLHLEWRSVPKQNEQSISKAIIQLHARTGDLNTKLEVPIFLTENRS